MTAAGLSKIRLFISGSSLPTRSPAGSIDPAVRLREFIELAKVAGAPASTCARRCPIRAPIDGVDARSSVFPQRRPHAARVAHQRRRRRTREQPGTPAAGHAWAGWQPINGTLVGRRVV